MKKIVKIKESELVNLIDKIITESTKGVKTKNTVSKRKPVVNETKKITLNELRTLVKQIIKEEFQYVLGVYEDPRYGMSVDVFPSMRDFDQKLQSNNWKKVTVLFAVAAKDIEANIQYLKKKYNIK
jgi:hypothetical protein